MYRTISVEVDVDVDLSYFDTEDLVRELESRERGNIATDEAQDLLQVIYEKRRTGKDYQSELDLLIFNALGRIA